MVIQDELSNRLSDRMNRNMYLLSVVAAIFLPLGFLTGLLGVNVAGIPGTDSPWAPRRGAATFHRSPAMPLFR